MKYHAEMYQDPVVAAPVLREVACRRSNSLRNCGV